MNPSAPTLAQGWTVKGSGELTAIPGIKLPFRSSLPSGGHSATQSELDRFAAHAQVIDAHHTADGNADFYEVRRGQPGDRGAAPILIIFVRGTTEAIRLPSSTETGHDHLVDAVVASRGGRPRSKARPRLVSTLSVNQRSPGVLI